MLFTNAKPIGYSLHYFDLFEGSGLFELGCFVLGVVLIERQVIVVIPDMELSRVGRSELLRTLY